MKHKTREVECGISEAYATAHVFTHKLRVKQEDTFCKPDDNGGCGGEEVS